MDTINNKTPAEQANALVSQYYAHCKTQQQAVQLAFRVVANTISQRGIALGFALSQRDACPVQAQRDAQKIRDEIDYWNDVLMELKEKLYKVK